MEEIKIPSVVFNQENTDSLIDMIFDISKNGRLSIHEITEYVDDWIIDSSFNNEGEGDDK